MRVEAVTAAVVPESEPLDERAVRAALRATLAGYKIPKQVLFVDRIPRNAMGKIDRSVLRRRLLGSER